MVSKRAKKGARREPLSLEKVLSAALELVDAEGLEALSMRRLAQVLKVEAMSLYNHVANKEDILDGDAYIYGFTLHKLNFPLDPAEYASAAKQFLPRIPVEQYPSLNGMSQEVISGRHNGLHPLEFGLDLLLEGLERMRK